MAPLPAFSSFDFCSILPLPDSSPVTTTPECCARHLNLTDALDRPAPLHISSLSVNSDFASYQLPPSPLPFLSAHLLLFIICSDLGDQITDLVKILSGM